MGDQRPGLGLGLSVKDVRKSVKQKRETKA